MSNDLITCETVAKRLGVHISTVRAWIRAGKVPAYRLGQRFTRLRWSEVLGSLGRTAASGRDK